MGKDGNVATYSVPRAVSPDKLVFTYVPVSWNEEELKRQTAARILFKSVAGSYDVDRARSWAQDFQMDGRGPYLLISTQPIDQAQRANVGILDLSDTLEKQMYQWFRLFVATFEQRFHRSTVSSLLPDRHSSRRP